MLHPLANKSLNVNFLTSRRFRVPVSGAIGVALALLTSSAQAHTIKTAQGVAATFHIEPNHNPKAGETAQAWFALTRQGGEPIPLEQCNCELAVYADRDPTKTPLLRPPLTTIVAEARGLPGAVIVFPKAGIYELKLSGRAKDNQSFQPFELSYTVTVQAGKTAAQTAQSQNQAVSTQASSTPSAAQNWVVPGVAIVALLSLATVRFLHRK